MSTLIAAATVAPPVGCAAIEVEVMLGPHGVWTGEGGRPPPLDEGHLNMMQDFLTRIGFGSPSLYLETSPSCNDAGAMYNDHIRGAMTTEYGDDTERTISEYIARRLTECDDWPNDWVVSVALS